MNDSFFPQNLSQWLGVIAILFGWGVIVWRAWAKLTGDINQVGERVNEIKIASAQNNTEIVNIKIAQQRSDDNTNAMRERLASTERELETLSTELREERLAVMTMLHNNEKAAAERDARTREELAAIRERLHIEKMVQSVVRNMRGHNAQG
jgi:predicted  nucleic acid-binding Zn-ribbon protein